VRKAFSPFLDHPLRLSRHEIEQWIAAHVHEPVRLEHGFDLLLGPAAEEWKLVADRRVLNAHARTLPRLCRGANVELPVNDDKAPSRSKDPNPLVDRRLGVRERPEQMTADDQVEAARRERQLLGVGLLEPNRDSACRRFSPRLGEHRGREVDAGNLMTAGRKLEAEEAGAKPQEQTTNQRALGSGTGGDVWLLARVMSRMGDLRPA
jgi:hypothetical protein